MEKAIEIKRKIKKFAASIVRTVVPDVVFYEMVHPFNQIPNEGSRARLRGEVKKQVRKMNSEWDPDVKVFGIGLSRTGTASLRRALEVLGGEKSLHWKKDGMVLGWPEFFYADAATDISCSNHFEALYHTFEESKFIYTTRDIEGWRQSIKKHFNNERRFDGEIEHPIDLRKRYRRAEFWDRRGFSSAIREVQTHEGSYIGHDTWEKAYYAHDERVRRFFEDKPENRFLEMDIVSGEGWDVLCPFLGVDTPDRPFPHFNRSE